jgi:hypothetical protein
MLVDTIQDVVERIDRHADRYRSSGDAEGEERALDAAARAASARSVDEALGIETALVGVSFAGPMEVPKKRSWWRRLFGGSDDNGFDNDDS